MMDRYRRITNHLNPRFGIPSIQSGSRILCHKERHALGMSMQCRQTESFHLF